MTTPDDYTEYEDGLAEQHAEFAHESVKDYYDPTADQPVPEAEFVDDGECNAEFIDGSYSYCGCDYCDERETNDREAHFEAYGEMP